MDSVIIIAIAIALFVLGAPVFLLIWQAGLRRRLAEVERQLGIAQADIVALREERRAAPAAVEVPVVERGAEEARAPETAMPEDPERAAGPWARRAAARAEAVLEEVREEDRDTAAPREDISPAPGEAAVRSGRGVEESLTSTWLVWLGGITVALGAVFLFRYAVDEGWLTPMARVILGLLAGGALLAAGEWTERHPVEAVRRAMRPDYVPPALTGAGVVAIYAALYAAYALFGLLTGSTAFVALALVSWSALGLSLRQGPFVAVLGLLCGYILPALIASEAPQAGPLFLYLLLLTAGCLLVMVWRKWWWFSYLTLAGAFVWPVIWMAGMWSMSDQFVLSLYALGLAFLFASLSTSLPVKRTEATLGRWLLAVVSNTSGIGFALSGVLLLWVSLAAGFGAGAFVFIGLLGAGALALSAWRGSLEGVLVIAAAVAVIGVLVWPEPATLTPLSELETFPRAGYGPFAVPVEYRLFMRAVALLAALFGVGGFTGALRERTPVVWAGVSTVVPLVLYALAYWRIGGFETDVSWAGVGAALAVLFTGAAVVLGRRAAARGNLALALYAAGATAALGLAFACVLREAWLTVALSAETLALAWIWAQVGVRELRAIAGIVTGIVILRLVANPMVLDYTGGFAGLFGWVVYGYGLPAAANLLAARIFARGGRDGVTTLCEIAGAGLAFLMVALQLRLWTTGEIGAAPARLFDQAVQSLWWITGAGLLLAEARRGERGWTKLAGTGLLAIAGIAVLAAHVVTLSPLMTGEPVGRLPVVNLLGLAYLLPAVLFAGLAASDRVALAADARRILWALAGLLVFLFVTLEIRRGFQGTDIALTKGIGDGELYAYSAVWIVFALALLGFGIRQGSVVLRYASLAVLMVTVAKVFLIDMSGLTGLLRVASFLGLGLTLIAIGRVYQRFVLRPTGGTPEG
jgi:uncharacterized membrane protein